jgi:hypothetical protein
MLKEKVVEMAKARCKTCIVQFEYLKSQRKNAQYCSRACYNEFLRRPWDNTASQENVMINKNNPGWVKQLFDFLSGK